MITTYLSRLRQRWPLWAGGRAATALLAVLLADAATKIAATALPLAGVVLLPGALSLRHMQNDGFAFSTSAPQLLLHALPLLALCVLLWLFRLEQRPAVQLGVGLLLGGGVANAADRLLHGSVRDMIALEGLFVFNVADIGITLGVLLVLWASLRTPSSSVVNTSR